MPQAYFSDSGLSSAEVRRGLNDVFAYDLIPDPTIISAALHACRRTNDFATCAAAPRSRHPRALTRPCRSVRIFEGIRDKSPDDQTYDYVVDQLRGTIDELQLSLPEELGF